MKKGQSLEFPFKAIFITVVAVLTLFLGYQIVYNLTKLGDEAEMSVMYKNLEKRVNECYNLDMDSICSLSTVNIPRTVLEICFINVGSSATNIHDPVIRRLAESSSRDNVFVIKTDDSKIKNIKFTINNLRVASNSKCFEAHSGKIYAELINKGTFIEIN